MDIRLAEPFFNSTKNIVNEMTGIEVGEISAPSEQNGDFQSLGVASVITFSGKFKGRFIIDLPPELALKMVGNMMGEDLSELKDTMFLAGISEMNNTIAGDANTFLNNKLNASLRLAPPIVFVGKNAMVAAYKMNSVCATCSTQMGDFKIYVGFQGGGGK